MTDDKTPQPDSDSGFWLDDVEPLRIDGDVILFWLACIVLGMLVSYVLVTHTPYWCG
jgi:hypothetical protein